MRIENTQKDARLGTNSILGKRGAEWLHQKSYLLNTRLCIVCLATVFASMIFTGCSKHGGTLSFKTSGEAVTECRAYLSTLRSEENATIERLTSSVKEWRTLDDSIIACLDRDTTVLSHSYPKAEYRQVKDSIIIELCRLAQSKARSYHGLFYLKEQTSSFNDDTELKEAVKSVEPFFASLDTVPLCIEDGKEVVMKRYRTFLKSSLAKGIHDENSLRSFLKDEYKHFMAFLQFLPDFADCGMTDIMRDTEDCCASILKAAGSGGLSHKDAVVYLTMRTNKRLIANAKMALADIHNSKVKNEECARAYVWMLIQPFMAMDDFSFAVLSDSEKGTMYGIADALPKAFRKLDKHLGDGKERLPEMPSLLMKIHLTRL